MALHRVWGCGLMVLKQPRPTPGDPRLKGHETDYCGSHGGWVKQDPKPVPGTPKKEDA